MIKFFYTRLLSLRNAFIGWWYVIRTQKNAWIHAVATVVVCLVGFWLKLSMWDWAVIVLVIAMVWTAEFLNTALEIVVDLASPDLHPLARVGKDVGAAAVLIAAASSTIIGILIMGKPFIERLQHLWSILRIK
ncbi:MAG TPA: diacylglycerol kinase family protein [Brevefilum fermentans]|jgi:diacylglycerol kinase (ATP)|uniref:Putative diacylglycerol kinase n=1 Tax=Candidatus Brevifilum fermentans TaxID=1986204 RepID=A0A1Y6K4E3_9CHLR|nr:diacylglycerol kinase family protein [Brevefilum fermentans]MDI9566510.1 diacylglycerol kinase family protein [Chloroflexota bacterium]SMX54484.1 putative diacylglycerol kinase [Brevefilum fermentans]HQA28920.1 diacylglycerol kinase family protein [Brevefilum fermentans]